MDMPPDQSSVFVPGLLRGQVAIVTGGGTGLGRAIALELSRLGAIVAIGGRRPEPLQTTAGLIADAGGECLTLPLDVRDAQSAGSFVDSVLEKHGKIDLLVNNAGGQFFGPAEDISPNGFHAVVRLNLEGTWLMTNAVANKAMIPAGAGRVVSITLSPHQGMPGMAHSSAARAGVENLMRVLSIEWARFGIKLNAVAPGQIETDAMEKYPGKVRESIAASIPAGRLGRPEEIAWMVAFLASPAGDFVSGTTITIDGARDNWVGPWPPREIADSSGKAVAEERKPPATK